MKTDIFNLQIIPLKDILPHELFDESRSKLLAGRLKKDDILCNPIIVTPLSKNKFIQLDGMNRLSTFRTFRLKSILSQIVDYQDMDNVELSSWLHLIDSDLNTFLKNLGKVPGLLVSSGKLEQVKNRFIQSESSEPIAMVLTSNLEVFNLSCNGNLIDKIKTLNNIVDSYKADIVRDVLPQSSSGDDIRSLFKEHYRHKLMVVFPTFTRHQIMKVVRKGGLFPPGITRHVIKGRCLNLNIPLNIFADNRTVKEQNEYLELNLRNRKFRRYEEPTIYFE